jgi:hypothetical protein
VSVSIVGNEIMTQDLVASPEPERQLAEQYSATLCTLPLALTSILGNTTNRNLKCQWSAGAAAAADV